MFLRKVALLGIHQMKIQGLGKRLQYLDAADTVSLAVQSWAVTPDPKAIVGTGNDAAADTTLGRELYLYSKFSGAIIHSTGEHQRLYRSNDAAR